MNDMADKSQADTGNSYVFVVNRKLWNDVNTVLGDYLGNYKTDGTYLYSKSTNKGMGGYVAVGATYDTYIYAGNKVTFMVDRALSREYPDKGYGVCIDLTEDKTTAIPAIAKFSLDGGDMIVNTIEGVGGASGNTSGSVSSNVAGSKRVIMGYGGIMVATPYRSVILREA